MRDIRFIQIEQNQRVVFILNKRGEKSRLLHGFVFRSDPKSIVIQDDSGKFHWLKRSKRAFDDGRMIGLAVILPSQTSDGEILDCIGQPIVVGDEVAFMEVPSQGFSTSLVVGEVLCIAADGVTIRVESSVIRKYMRRPEEIAVVGKYHKKALCETCLHYREEFDSFRQLYDDSVPEADDSPERHFCSIYDDHIPHDIYYKDADCLYYSERNYVWS